jgi:hypothetical protein
MAWGHHIEIAYEFFVAPVKLPVCVWPDCAAWTDLTASLCLALLLAPASRRALGALPTCTSAPHLRNGGVGPSASYYGGAPRFAAWSNARCHGAVTYVRVAQSTPVMLQAGAVWPCGLARALVGDKPWGFWQWRRQYSSLYLRVPPSSSFFPSPRCAMRPLWIVWQTLFCFCLCPLSSAFVHTH